MNNKLLVIIVLCTVFLNGCAVSTSKPKSDWEKATMMWFSSSGQAWARSSNLDNWSVAYNPQTENGYITLSHTNYKTGWIDCSRYDYSQSIKQVNGVSVKFLTSCPNNSYTAVSKAQTNKGNKFLLKQFENDEKVIINNVEFPTYGFKAARDIANDISTNAL